MTDGPTSALPLGYHDFAGLGRLRADAARDPNAHARQAAQQFEAHFVQYLFKTMRASIERSDLFDTASSDLFQELMDKEVAAQIAQRGSLGLADMLMRQLQPAAPAEASVALKNPAVPPTPVAGGAALAQPSTQQVLSQRAPYLSPDKDSP